MPPQAFECGVSVQLRSTPHRSHSGNDGGLSKSNQAGRAMLGDAAGEILQLFCTADMVARTLSSLRKSKEFE